MTIDISKELQEASNEELLEAVLYHYDLNAIVVHHKAALIRLGFALAQEDGWRHVALAWLAEYRNRKPLFHE